MTINLLTPILDGGIANTHFFNGRLLTAEALRDEQNAQRRQHEALGQAAGAGIISGLTVRRSTLTPEGNVVHVSGGLALNGLGQPLAVPESGLEITLLTGPQTAPTATAAGLFADCATPTTATPDLPLNAFILALTPASGFQGKAPMHGLNDQGAINGCGSRYAVAGIQFRLVGLNVAELEGISPATRSQLNTLLASDNDNPARLARLRNLLAHLCFGTEELALFAVDPFALASGASDFARYGALDAVGLHACDVPLALLHITNRGIRFIDNWAARRQVTPAPLSTLWPLPTADRRQAEGAAIFLQFEEQITQLVQTNPATAVTIQATDYFRYLPPAGLLRLNAGTQPGVSANTFFTGIPAPASPITLEGACLLPLLHAARHYPPIDLLRGEAIWLYRVRENDASGAAQPYLLFTSGHMPPMTYSRFDVNRWNYFHFS
ncbi:MAG: hypothetical protein H6659_07310 [Ardenticatenaceae bacterium]|nr:hypothetical protein [Ardenticatenaceae bacterium]